MLGAARRRDAKHVNTLRLLALVSMIRGDVPEAKKILCELEVIAPDWEIVRRTRASVLYVGTLASPFMQNPASSAPEPIEWPFVRQDDAAIRDLNEAATIFCELSEDLDRPREDRQMLEVWRLGCLANNAAEKIAAADYCGKLIAEHPCNIYAIPWAIARSYPVDFARAIAIADKLVTDDPNNVRPILIGAGCRLHTGDVEGARKLLLRANPLFERQGQKGVWSHWWAMLLLASDDYEGALEFVLNCDERQELRRIEVAALYRQAVTKGDSGRLKDRLIQLYRETSDPRYLLSLAEQNAHDGNWLAIAERSDELLRAVPTPGALHFALMADFQIRKWDRCFSRTQEFRHWFREGRLPIDVKRLRVGCLQRLGKPKDALKEADDLLNEDTTTSTLARFAALCAGYGDIRRAEGAARDLVNREDLRGDDAIEVAEVLMVHDPDISRALLRRAKAADIADSRVFKAVDLGQRLSIENEQRDLWTRLVTLAEQQSGPVRAVQQLDFLRLVADAQQSHSDLSRMYEAGLIRRSSHLFDMHEDAFRRFVQHVSGMESPFARFTFAADAAKASLPWFYSDLQQQLKYRERITWIDFLPPDGNCLLAYYDLASGYGGNAKDMIRKAASELPNRLGAAQAAARFAAIPAPLPESLEACFVQCEVSEQKQFLHAVLRAGPSPVHQIHAIRLAFLAPPDPVIVRLRQRLLRGFLSPAGRSQRLAYFSVLSWATAAFDGWHPAREWQRSVRLLLGWAHASHLFAIFQRVRVPLDWLAQDFSRPREYGAITDLEDDFSLGRDPADPRMATPEAIAVSGLAYALSEVHAPLPDDMIGSAAKDWLTDIGVPHLQLLAIPPMGPGAFDSFLARDHFHDLCMLLGESVAGEYSGEWRTKIKDHALSAISGDEQQWLGWRWLAALYRDQATAEHVSAQIEGCLTQLDFRLVAEHDRESGEAVLQAILGRVAHVKGDDARKAITSSLVVLADWYGAHSGTSAEAETLMDLVLAHAYPVSDRQTTVAEFEDLCLKIAEKFPRFAERCRFVVHRFCIDLPSPRGAEFWPLELKLRVIDHGNLT